LSKAKIEKFVAAGVPVGKSEAWLWDSAVTGLGLRMRLTGSVSWLFRLSSKGRWTRRAVAQGDDRLMAELVRGRGAVRRADENWRSRVRCRSGD
jgi:hypothetical protein